MGKLTMQFLLLGAMLAVAACGRSNPLGNAPSLRDPADPANGGTGAAGIGGAGTGGGSAVAGATGTAGDPGVRPTAGIGGPSVMPPPAFPQGGAGAPPGAGTGAGGGSCVGPGCMNPGFVECFPDGWCCDSSGACWGGDPGFPPEPPPTTNEPWDPPIELGEPGWRDSEDPLCTGEAGWIASHSVWADSRGVFVIVEASGLFGPMGFPGGPFGPFPGGPFPGFGCMGEYCGSQTIFVNDGTEWEPFFERDSSNFYFPGQNRLTGVDGGPLFVYGYAEEPDGPCGLATIHADGTRACEPVYGVEHIFVVDQNLAYGVLEGSLVRYDGEEWGPLPTVVQNVYDMSRVWASATELFATTYNAGRIYNLSDGTLTIQDTRTLERFSAIWGFGENDVWAGTETSVMYHYDGTSWTGLPWPASEVCRYQSGIRNIWGHNGVVYFHSDTRIGRIVDGEIETLAEWPCDDSGQQLRITSIWGRSENEVFVALVDQSIPLQECGMTFLLHFDGSEFHRF